MNIWHKVFLGKHLTVKDALLRIGAMFLLGGMLSVSIFVLFFHLTQFETTDEDLWKEKRIVQYWKGWEKGLEEGDWSKIRINDKPGVSVAILSSLGLSEIDSDPAKNEITKKTNGKYLYLTYRVRDSEIINFGFRYPLVIFTVIVLTLSVFLVYWWSRSLGITVLFGIYVILNPVLLGISKVINPDTILWSSALVAILFYLISLRKGGWMASIASGLFFGWAILSKYTGNLLTLFFLILLIFHAMFVLSLEDSKAYAKAVRKRLAQLVLSTGIGYALFVALFPIAWFESKYFFQGTFLSRGMEPIIIPMVVCFGMILVDNLFFSSFILRTISRWIRQKKSWILRIIATPLLILIAFHLYNAWMGTPIIPLNDVSEVVKENILEKPMSDGPFQIPIQEGDAMIWIIWKKILFQSISTVFTLPSAVLFALIISLGVLLYRGKTRHTPFVLFALCAPWIFFVGGIFADVLVEVRYGILLQFILGILSAILFAEAIGVLRWEKVKMLAWGVSIFGFLTWQGWALSSIAPFELNYHNDFLPREYSFANSWSYGMYEAAQWLNAQPNATELEVRSNRKAFCRYFVGKCIKSKSIDFEYISPDYFVISRGEAIKEKSHFKWKNPPEGIRDASWYYSEESLANPAWELHIGNRPNNYIKVLRFSE